MHPDSLEENEIKSDAELLHYFQARQPTVQPGDLPGAGSGKPAPTSSMKPGVAWEKSSEPSIDLFGIRRFVAIYHFAGVEVYQAMGPCSRNRFVFGHCFLSSIIAPPPLRA